MAEFSAIVQQLVQAYERDVGSLRTELARSGRAPECEQDSEVPYPPRQERPLSVVAPWGPQTPDQSRPPKLAGERPESTLSTEFEEDVARMGPAGEKLQEAASKVVFQLEEMESCNAGQDTAANYRNKVGNLRIRKDEESGLEKLLVGPLESVVGFVILLNAALTFLQLQLRGLDAGASLNSESGDDRSPKLYTSTVDTAFLTLEHVFNAFFLMEFVARISLLRHKFFRFEVSKRIQWFNLFDTFIIILCSIDLYLTPLLSGGQTTLNLTFTRVLRLGRLARTLKIIQVLKAFSKLRILVNTVAASVLSFAWSMIIVAVFNAGGAIFLCQMLQPVIEDETVEMDLRIWLDSMYGTSFKAVWTMFEFTFSGGWPQYARPIIEGVHWSYSIFFALYVSIVVFAVIRIITALFLKDTLSVAAKDADFMVQESMRAKREYASKLKELFEVADVSGNGTVDYEEFKAICSIPEVIHYFHILELEVSEVHGLFDLLDEGNGQVTYDEFLRGIIRLKGTARSMDVLVVSRECEAIHSRCLKLEEMLAELGCGRGPCGIKPWAS